MSSVQDRLRKRRFYPVVIDCETVHIRALLNSELAIVQALPFRNEDDSIGYLIGCSLLNEDHSPVFIAASADESPKQFGARVLADLDLPTDTRAELIDKILKLSNGPTKEQSEALAKN